MRSIEEIRETGAAWITEAELAMLCAFAKRTEAEVERLRGQPSVAICREERAEGNGGCGACALCCKEWRDRAEKAEAEVERLRAMNEIEFKVNNELGQDLTKAEDERDEARQRAEDCCRMGEKTCAALVAERDEWRDTARSEMAGRRAAEAEVERLRADLRDLYLTPWKERALKAEAALRGILHAVTSDPTNVPEAVIVARAALRDTAPREREP